MTKDRDASSVLITTNTKAHHSHKRSHGVLQEELVVINNPFKRIEAAIKVFFSFC